ncbi:MAG: NAD(P)-dependent oxidoreductase [Patescibacteria group bacterium]
MKNKIPKTLITGADGMVGSYVDFGIKTDRESLDVTNLNEVFAVVKRHKPKVIIHLAALTDLDAQEKNPSYAYEVNTIGTYNMALAAQAVEAKFVYVSSIGVFDGTKKGPYTESDTPNPQNYYGHSKYAGELIVQALLKDYIIARSGWMFGGGPSRDKKFVAKIITQLGNKDILEIKALDDVIGSPTFAKDLIATLKKLILKNAKGIFHLTNKGICSRYDIAKHIVEFMKPETKVVAVDSSYFNLPARRVGNESAKSKVNLMRPWKEALTEYLTTEWKPTK